MKYYSQSSKILIITSISIICYINTLPGTFVFDDSEAVLKNADVNPETPLMNIFQNDFWGTKIKSNSSHKSYRPLTVVIYKTITYLAGNKDALWFHVINLVTYSLICSILYVTLKNVFTCESVAFIAAILFTVHPVHTEVVASIVGLADLLSSLMFCLSFLCFNKAVVESSVLHFISSLLLGAASMFFKETGITILGVCLIYNFLIRMKTTKTISALIHNRKFMMQQSCLLITALLLLYVRWKIMDFTKPTFQLADNPASFAEKFLTRFLSHNYIYSVNFLILLWPQWLCFDWSMGCIPLLETAYDTRIINIIIFWAILSALVFTQIKNRSLAINFSTFLVIIPFLPASNILFRVGFVIAERTLFLPSIGFSLLVACGYHRLEQKYNNNSKTIRFAFWALILILAAKTRDRGGDWLNERRLFKSALDVCPGNAKVHYNVAKVLGDSGSILDAEHAYRTALNLQPDYEQAMNNLANLLRDKGELKEAEELLRRAVEIRPNFAAAWMNLGIVLATAERYNESEKAYHSALAHRKDYADCHYNIGNLYLKLGKHEEALNEWSDAVKSDRKHSAAWGNMLTLLDSLGTPGEKILQIAYKALEARPDVAALHFTVANILGKMSRWKEAKAEFLIAIKLNPKVALYRSNLGVLYHRWGKKDDARREYIAALQIDPQLKSAQINLKKLEEN